MNTGTLKNRRYYFFAKKNGSIEKALSEVARLSHKAVSDLIVYGAKDAGKTYLIFEDPSVGSHWAITRAR
jgi:hypothetical protein